MNNEKYNISIDELELSIRAYNGLRRGGIKTVADIIKFGDLKRIRNLGQKSIIEIVSRLREYNVDPDDLSKISGGKRISKYEVDFNIKELYSSSLLETIYRTPIKGVSIDELELSVRTYNCLEKAGIKTIGDISFRVLSHIDGIGQKTIKEIAYKVKEYIAYYKNSRAVSENLRRYAERKKEQETMFSDPLEARYRAPIKSISIDELELSIRAYNGLRRGGIKTVADIIKFGDLKRIRNLGQKSIIEIVSRLREYNVDPDDLSKISGGKRISKYEVDFNIKELYSSSLLETIYRTPIKGVSIDELELSVRTYNCLEKAGIKTIGDISFRVLSHIDGIGQKTIKEIAYKVKEYIAYYKNSRAVSENLRRYAERKKEQETKFSDPLEARYGAPIKSISIDELEITVKTYNGLRRGGIKTVADINKFGDLSKIRGMGKKSIIEITNKLKENFGIDYREILLTKSKEKTEDSITNVKEKTEEDITTMPIKDLGLSTRAFNGLSRGGIKTVEEVLIFGNLKGIRNLGESTYQEIISKLDEIGYVLNENNVFVPKSKLFKSESMETTPESVVKDDSIEILRTEVEEKEEKSKLLDEAIELAKQHSKLKETESKLDKEIKRKEELLKGFGFIYEKE